MADSFAVYTPIVTPFAEDGAADRDALASLVDHLVSAGVDGLVPCGTTGEFGALTDEELRAVVATTVDSADGGVTVIAGAGGTAVDDVRERLATVADAGADAALLVPPYYGGQASSDGNEAFFRAVLEDAPLPAYLYNVPSAAGQRIDPDTVASLADHPSVTGLKDSSGDLAALDEAIARTPDDFTVFQGWDSQFVPALAMGADGGINALTHLLPEVFADAAAAVDAGDLDRARERQFDAIDPAFRTCQDHGVTPSIKAALGERGVLPTDAVRPPHRSLSSEDRGDLLDRIE